MSDSSNFRLDGCVAIVTGGAGGIGYETATALQESGAQTVLISIQTSGKRLPRNLRPLFPGGPDQVRTSQKVAEQVQQKYGRLWTSLQ